MLIVSSARAYCVPFHLAIPSHKVPRPMVTLGCTPANCAATHPSRELNSLFGEVLGGALLRSREEIEEIWYLRVIYRPIRSFLNGSSRNSPMPLRIARAYVYVTVVQYSMLVRSQWKLPCTASIRSFGTFRDSMSPVPRSIGPVPNQPEQT